MHTPSRLGAEPLSPTQIFFGWRGRIPRRTWWLYGVGALLAVGIYATVLLRVLGLDALYTDALVNLLLLWPALAVSVKRWHDRDKSGWWVLVALIPLIGWLWVLIENGCRRGSVGPNRFGEDLTGRL